MEAEALVGLGLTRIEAKVYLALLELGSAKAGAIARKAGLNRTTTYDALERLLAKGLASFSNEGAHRVYAPVEPRRLVELLEERREAASLLLPDLESLMVSEKLPVVSVYRGRKGVNTVLSRVLRFKSYESFGAGGQFWESMGHDFYAFQRKKRKLGLRGRVLIPNTTRSAPAVKKSFASFRFLPREFATPSTAFIFGDNVALITWVAPPLAIVISDANIAKAYRNHFEALWKTARK